MKVNASPELSELRQGFGWGLALGIMMMILGIIAIAEPFFVTLAATFMFGWVLVLNGICRVIYAFRTRKAGIFLLKLLLGALYVAGGLLLMSDLLKGMLTLTLALGILIFVNGVLETFLAFQLRPAPNWGWILASGIAGVILGIFIGSEWPSNAVWVIGILVGTDLLTSGWWMLSVSLAARSALSQET